MLIRSCLWNTRLECLVLLFGLSFVVWVSRLAGFLGNVLMSWGGFVLLLGGGSRVAKGVRLRT